MQFRALYNVISISLLTELSHVIAYGITAFSVSMLCLRVAYLMIHENERTVASNKCAFSELCSYDKPCSAYEVSSNTLLIIRRRENRVA